MASELRRHANIAETLQLPTIVESFSLIKENFSPSAPSMSKTLGVLPFFWGAAFPLGGCLSFGGCLLSLTLPLTLTIPFSLFASLRLLFLFIRFAKPREVQGTAKNDYHKKFGAKF